MEYPYRRNQQMSNGNKVIQSDVSAAESQLKNICHRRRRVRVLNMQQNDQLPSVLQTPMEQYQLTPKAQKDVSSDCLYRWLFCCWRREKIKLQPIHKVVTQKNLRQFVQHRRSRKVQTILCEQKCNKKTLVLDLDQTLVRSRDQLQKWDFKIQFIHDGKEFHAYTKMRHGLDEFLSVMSQHYELVVFTASMPDLASKVIDRIDPQRLISHRIFRQHCIEVEYANKIFLKNLNLLNRKLTDVVLLDNSRNSGLLNPQNLLLISSFYQDEEDRELIDLIPFLIYLSEFKDVRDVERHRQEYFIALGKQPMYCPDRRRSRRKFKTVKMQVQLCEPTSPNF